MKELPKGGYCYRVHNYDQYLHDVGELRAMGYTIDDAWNGYMITQNKGFNKLHLHIEDSEDGVALHNHSLGAERVPNLEFIINELPDLRIKA